MVKRKESKTHCKLDSDDRQVAHMLFDGTIRIMCNGQRGSIVTQIGVIGTRVGMGEH